METVLNGERPPPKNPINWNKAKEIVHRKDPSALAELRRSAAQSQYYKKRRSELLKEYASIADSVKIRILKYNFVLTQEGLKEVLPKRRREGEPVFIENEFPYFFEPSIEHHVIWNDKELEDGEIETFIQKNRPGYVYVWFRNPPALQTIPELWHVHVLSTSTPCFS